MLKLAIAAGITLSALLCGMMTLRSSGLFQNSNKNGAELINDIKEIFGFPPIGASNAQIIPSKSGETSSFSLAREGGYLPPKSNNESDDNDSTEMTTQIFRIFILSTTPPPNVSTDSISSSTHPPKTSSNTTPSTSSTSPASQQTISASSVSTKETIFKEETLTERTTLESLASSPTPYEFQGNPSPAFKIDLIWSTLSPPSLNNSENEVVIRDYTKPAKNEGSVATLPNNGVYLPPSKEYLPPKQ